MIKGVNSVDTLFILKRLSTKRPPFAISSVVVDTMDITKTYDPKTI